MADIQSTILSKYGIDIAQENIFKLYKIDSCDISEEELSSKIASTRKRWNTSINGANEKNAERDRARLDKADKYEAILKDAKLRKKVFSYYKGASGGNGRETGSSPEEGPIGFAREYFKLVATTKKPKKKDVDFFFEYYQSERKNKQAICEMLAKEFKIKGLGKGNKIDDSEEESYQDEGKKKDESSPLITNLFQKATVLKIQRAAEKYEEAAQNNELCQRYPKLKDSLYDFLEVDSVTDAQQFADLMACKSKAAYALRQEKGQDYVPLVDMFNKLHSISNNKDVVDNIPEFKLLLKYPDLTPYMFTFVKMKRSTIKGLFNIANLDYGFRNETDFILTYYQPVHDNFNISNSGIANIIRRAEKKTKQNKILNSIDSKLGRKKKRGLPINAKLISLLAYWPIFIIYLVFEIVKLIFAHIRLFTIPVFLFLFIRESQVLPARYGLDNLQVLRKMYYKAQWVPYLNDVFHLDLNNGLAIAMWTLVTIFILLALYGLPALFGAAFVFNFGTSINKEFDWQGLTRTFKQILADLNNKAETQYKRQRGTFVKKKIPAILINIISLVIVIEAVHVVPPRIKDGINKFSETTGYGQNETVSAPEKDLEENVEDDDSSKEKTMVITAEAANIRADAGTDYDVVLVASKGDTFTATGNQKTTSSGKIWYEIYTDTEMTQTGWCSQKVIDFQ